MLMSSVLLQATARVSARQTRMFIVRPPGNRGADPKREGEELSNHPQHEISHGAERLLGLVPVRGVAAFGQEDPFGRAAGASLDGFDLFLRAVLVTEALHDEERLANLRQVLLEVPFAELGIEPGAVPAQ